MKNYALPILVGLLIGGILSGSYLVWVKSKRVAPSVSEAQTATPTPTPAALLTWTDPNGFSFQYPEGLVVNKHDEDRENYAHLEFTHANHPGNLVVWGKDQARGVTDSDSWVKNEKRFIGAAVLDTELGGKPGKKVMIEGITRMAVIGAVYDSIVWTVEAKLEDADFWTNTQNAIVHSFAFVAPKAAGSESSAETVPSGEDVVVDEEEIIE